MAVRKNEPMGFVDAALDGLGGTRSATLLERLDAATPWETAEKSIDGVAVKPGELGDLDSRAISGHVPH